MATTRKWLVALFLLTAVVLLGRPASAQESWRFIFTPQVWFSNIPQNGFASSSGGGGGVFGLLELENLEQRGPDPTSVLFPQWGGQLAAQYGRWTFGLGAQYASFEHKTELFASQGQTLYSKELGFPANTPGGLFAGVHIPCSSSPLAAGLGLTCGTKVATEVVRTDRIDIDLTATYFFPDVLPRLMDLNTGAGFKWVRASGHRVFVDNDSFFALDYLIKGHDFPARNTPANETPRLLNKASFLDNIYAVTIPTTFNFHLTSNGKLLLPFTATPLIGWEERTDQVFGYDSSIAYGGTLDLGLRFVFDNGVAVYAGYRGQAIIGIDRYVAHGPLFNMSVPFGGR